jgi:hypothetical protein
MNPKEFKIKVLPRQSLTWEEFINSYPVNSIALDGVVSGGPRYDSETRHANFDHHDGVNREATMCTAMQVYMAIKGGIITAFSEDTINVIINDTDQDTSFAVWLLINYKFFEGIGSSPIINRLLDITNKLDTTGGAYPLNLRDRIIMQHNWVFSPYTHLRKSGQLAVADENVLLDNLEAILARLDKAHMGEAGLEELDGRYKILYETDLYKIIDEVGGNDARYILFGLGLKAFISIVAHKKDGNMVVSIGKRSQYIPFPVEKLYSAFNEAEGLSDKNGGWGGSGIVGGSPRKTGTKLTWEQLRDIADDVIAKEKNK